MPFVTIRILQGHPQERKDEMSRRVTDGDQRARRAAQGGGLGRVRGRDAPRTGTSAAPRSTSLKKAGKL